MEDLRRDKDDWICRSTGVTLVFQVNIDEDYTTLRRHQRSGCFQVRLSSLITLFRRQNGIPSENHYDTWAIQTANDTFKAIAQEVVVSDWVGPLSAHIEVWERSGNASQIRGYPVVSYDFMCNMNRITYIYYNNYFPFSRLPTLLI